MLPLNNYLEELMDIEKPVVASKLANMAELSSEELELFKTAWRSINVERRRQLAAMMAEIVRNSIDLEFEDAFRILLEDMDTEVRLKAIQGLEECENLSIVNPLIGLLGKHNDDATRAAAASALGKFAILSEVGKLQGCYANRIEHALLGIIRDKNEDVEVRRRAIEAIAPLSRSHVKDIIKRAYDSPDQKLKRSALCAMGRNCDRSWLPMLMSELNNTDPELRYEAAVACGELGEDECIPALIKLTRDTDIQVQLAAITSLGHIGGYEARQELTRYLNDPDERIREAAEIALDELGFSHDPLLFEADE